jgi:alkylhydroperoxidase family enzyme
MRSVCPRRLTIVSRPIDELRAAAAAAEPPHPVLAAYLEKVRNRAYAITDADVESLTAAGCSEDEILEQTVAVAIQEGLRRLDAGLRVLG